MYPHRGSHPANHKPGYCSDGAPVKSKLEPTTKDIAKDDGLAHSLQWPLPDGIFTRGKTFHPITFLQMVRVVYQYLVEENKVFDALELEHQSFARVLARQLVNQNGNKHAFKIPPGLNIDTSGAAFVFESKGAQYVCMECLRDDCEFGFIFQSLARLLMRYKCYQESPG